ncbi:MAG: sensor histidine kinase, partial [Candidatus Scalindua sp.]
GIATIARDITKTRELEEKLRITYKMSSLGRLTAGVFHEILNPLNIISSYAQLLLFQGKWSSKTEGDLKKILEEVNRIVKITDNLLSFSRRKELNAEKVKINSLLGKVISIVEPEMKLENIEVFKEFDEGVPEVIINRDELRQVFLNLIHNAYYAMADGGRLTISTQSIKKQGKLFVRTIFTDTGCGIPTEHLDKVFEPFYTSKKEGEGTGLGLSISYGIIDNHGGELNVDSEEGKGTTFTVDLPAET